MNIYPKWWNSTITVFNKTKEANQKISWYRTVLHNCFWKNSDIRVTIGQTAITTDSTICRIPISDEFVSKSEWENLEDKSTKFTLAPDDIIVLGEVSEDIDEYTAGKRSSEMLEKYRLQGCLQITTATINTGGTRGSEHYFVRGI